MKVKDFIKNLMVSGKKAVASANLIALAMVATPNYINAQEDAQTAKFAQYEDDTDVYISSPISAEEQALREHKVEMFLLKQKSLKDLFAKNPFLYQKYNGNVSKYQEDFADKAEQYINGLTDEDPTDMSIIEQGNREYCDTLCGDTADCAWHDLTLSMKRDANGEIHLKRNKEAFLECDFDNSMVNALEQTDVCKETPESCKCDSVKFNGEELFDCYLNDESKTQQKSVVLSNMLKNRSY